MNIGILFAAFLFWLLETSYFGWNITPQSDAELICDGIALMLAAMAFLGGCK